MHCHVMTETIGYKYNYLQSLRVPLTFDQLVGQQIDYVEGNKSRVMNNEVPPPPGVTAFT